MQLLTSYAPSRWTPAISASLVGTGMLATLGIVFGRGMRVLNLEAVLSGSALFLVGVVCILSLAERYGLVFLWMSSVGLWIYFLYSEFVRADWIFPEAIRMLPDAFFAWSMTTSALIGTTLTYLRAWKAGLVHWIEWTVALLFIAANAYLAGHAPDVGDNPRDHPMAIGIAALTIPFAFLASIIFMIRVRRVFIRRESTR